MSEEISENNLKNLQSSQNIDQKIDSNQGPVQAVNALGDAYAEQHTYFIFNSPSSLLNSDLPRPNTFKRFTNYIKGILFLLSTLISWFFLGLFAHDAFPFEQVLELFLSCFKVEPNKGIENIWGSISQHQLNLRDLQEYDLKNKNISYTEASRLNKLGAEYWLLKKLIRILSDGSTDEGKRIASALESLEEREDYLREQLEPLKDRFFPKLKNIQSIWESIYSSKNQNNIKLNHFVASLIQKFSSISAQPSSREVDNLLSTILHEIEMNETGMSGVQRKTLDRFLELLQWVADKEVSKDQNEYLSRQTEIVKAIESGQVLAIQERKKFHFNPKCTYLRSLRHSLTEKLEDSNKINIFKSVEEAERNGFSACGHCKRFQRSRKP